MPVNGEVSLHVYFLKQTFLLAREALLEGNRPFGSVLVIDGEAQFVAKNSVCTERDITAHAEMNLLRTAWKNVSCERLQQATLYCSTEPCLMCAGAIANTPVKHVVYGCRTQHLHAHMQQYPSLTGRTVLLSQESPVKVTGPLLEEALAIHTNSCWWQHSSLKT